MARRPPKQARKRKPKAAKRTAQTRGRRVAKRAARKPAPRRPARKAARVTSKSASRPAGRRAKTAQKRAKKAAKPPRKVAKLPQKVAKPPRKAAAPARPPQMAQDRGLRNPPASLNRARRTLDDTDNVPTPPSSLDMQRSASAARSGRAEIAESQADHQTMTPSITAGDVDASIQTAYFSGDEAPGGDNSTPDQDIVDNIGRAIGVQYQDNEELQSSEKVAERDRHRWELDPASSEDYRDRK